MKKRRKISKDYLSKNSYQWTIEKERDWDTQSKSRREDRCTRERNISQNCAFFHAVVWWLFAKFAQTVELSACELYDHQSSGWVCIRLRWRFVELLGSLPSVAPYSAAPIAPPSPSLGSKNRWNAFANPCSRSHYASKYVEAQYSENVSVLWRNSFLTWTSQSAMRTWNRHKPVNRRSELFLNSGTFLWGSPKHQYWKATDGGHLGSWYPSGSKRGPPLQKSPCPILWSCGRFTVLLLLWAWLDAFWSQEDSLESNTSSTRVKWASKAPLRWSGVMTLARIARSSSSRMTEVMTCSVPLLSSVMTCWVLLRSSLISISRQTWLGIPVAVIGSPVDNRRQREDEVDRVADRMWIIYCWKVGDLGSDVEWSKLDDRLSWLSKSAQPTWDAQEE